MSRVRLTFPNRCNLESKDSCAGWNYLGKGTSLTQRGIKSMVQMPGQEAFIYAATPRYILQCSTERKHGCKAIRTETIKDVHESYGLGYFAGSDGRKYINAGF